MVHYTRFSQFPFITVPLTSDPSTHYSQAPILALTEPVVAPSYTTLHNFVPSSSTLKMTAITQLTLIGYEKKAKGLIELGIEEIKQHHYEEGLSHFQEGFNSVPDCRFYTWLMIKWHHAVIGKIRENILVQVDTRLNKNPDDPSGKFVKALCCVNPELYFLAISLLRDILEEHPGHSMTKGLLKSIEQMNKRGNKQRITISNSEQVHRNMSIKRLLN